MTVWFTADTHFGHANIIKYCQRPFLSEQERRRSEEDPRGKWRISDATVRRHDNALLDAINERVAGDDDLWILGDFCWGRHDEAAYYRERIHCRNVHLIWGNHDHGSVASVFTDTYQQRMITVAGQPVWLCHYPARSWDRRFHGSWHLYGHVHGRFSAEDTLNPTMLTRDVGVDACDYRPWSFDEVCTYMEPRMQALEQLKQAMLRGEQAEIV